MQGVTEGLFTPMESEFENETFLQTWSNLEYEQHIPPQWKYRQHYWNWYRWYSIWQWPSLISVTNWALRVGFYIAKAISPIFNSHLICFAIAKVDITPVPIDSCRYGKIDDALVHSFSPSCFWSRLYTCEQTLARMRGQQTGQVGRRGR